MLDSYLSATLKRADLVLRLSDGQKHSRITVDGIEPVEHLALVNSGALPQLPRWAVTALDAALESHQWLRVGCWRIDAAKRTTTRVTTALIPAAS